ncbi:ABC transporter permease [Tistrella bauzanensis]|jgi:NitT/TauT family transport system permease protein|uniref:ABC transporter permease n=1 Tax=Tistrella arctica TaxID=3133430 RepID=A0ABU9YPC3_9PROT
MTRSPVSRSIDLAGGALLLAALLLPLTDTDSGMWVMDAGLPAGIMLLALIPFISAARRPQGSTARGPLVLAGALLGAVATIAALRTGAVAFGTAGPGFTLAGIAVMLAATRGIALVARLPEASAAARILPPAALGLTLLYAWEAGCIGFGVPPVLLPPPSAIGSAFVNGLPVLWADFIQTVWKGALRGYLIGCTAGILLGVAADRVAFLRRGLLPVANLMSAAPIVGIAPIMVMWFGFDWPSKAAVVVVTTLFPMLVNTLAGLSATTRQELDLMRSYGAGHLTTLIVARLPNALPFLFNGLKISATLALIAAIVAEFFGTPVVGMGFRISTEVARMNVDVVWATILVAALAGSGAYGLLSAIERRLTFWHPAMRGR